ncbi:MAG: VOC family protein [Ardenticatenaceae bacterium]
MQIVGLDHIQLAMPPGRENKARHFYSELLGLREIPKPEPLAARGGCWFEGTRISLHLGVEHEFVPARKAHLCFVVRDLAHARWLLEEAGIAITPDTTLPNVERFYTSDPFGNRIEFMQESRDQSYFSRVDK